MPITPDSHPERKALGDEFDATVRRFDGLPDVIKTSERTIRTKTKVLERTETFILQTIRQKDEGDTILIEFIGAEGSLRIALPPRVAAAIASQRDQLATKSRSKVASAAAADRKARGIAPGFMRNPR